jgi:short-subunit dehydrogenase
MSAVSSVPFFSIYCASKWALEGLSQSLLNEVSPLGISIVLIEPGATKVVE